MDVGDWLRSLGLERYEQAFRDNEIDAGLLSGLTPDDLKDFGVSLVGHRRRLLDAIVAPLGEAGASGPAVSAGVRPAAERRQLTLRWLARGNMRTEHGGFAKGSRRIERPVQNSRPRIT